MKPYKPHIQKRYGMWFVDDPYSNENPLPIAEARLRRLAQRWASNKNVEWVKGWTDTKYA